METKKPTIQTILISVLFVTVFALGLWTQNLSIQLAETKHKLTTSSTPDTQTQQIYSYLGAAIQAHVLPSGDELNKMLAQPSPTSLPTPSPTKKP